MTNQRFVPTRPYPPYTYVPGGPRPHPRSNPAGHSFASEEVTPPPLDPEQWTSSADYLFGLDLLNAGYFWEAHEVWEGLWHAAQRRGPVADFLKGLIHLAAAGVKHLQQNPRGVQSHAQRAAELWRTVAKVLENEKGIVLGFRLEELIGLATSIAAEGWPGQDILHLPLGL